MNMNRRECMNDHDLAIGLGYPLEAPDRARLEQALAVLRPQGVRCVD